jgi:uncharacterized OB-fold protein
MLPVTDDRDTGPFFAAAREGRLAYAACAQCNRAVHPPMPYCPHCGGDRIGWRTASGRGTLHGFTVVEHQVHPAFPAPSTVVLVALEETPDVRLVGQMSGTPTLQIGEPMEVWFEAKGEDVVLPQWRPADKGPG